MGAVKEWFVVSQGRLIVVSALVGGLRERMRLLRELGGWVNRLTK